MDTQQLLATASQTENWLRLAIAELPPRKLRELLESYDYDPARLFADEPIHWAMNAPGLIEKQAARLSAVKRGSVADGLAALERVGASIITLADPGYPINLREISDASPILFVRGTLCADDRFSVAIVGSRRATPYGMSIAERFGKELSARGLCVVSGGARGIDTRAHYGALAGGGRTVAFIGCGIDVNYPSDNRALYAQMVDSGQGAIVSEYAPGVEPEPWRFPARNRLISGMTMGTVVIESPIDSGAMITATDAASQGRDVFAVPGPIDTGRSTGCHKLIKEGAKLVETPQDIIDELGLLTLTSDDPLSTAEPYRAAPSDLAPDQRRVLDMLTLQPRIVDTLIEESGLPAPQVVGMLTLLEMRGLARRVPGNAFVRVL
ncbi:MAG TPA: DNA-processing protein DprA [Capsulimonadaceae bacterium]|jgi:DNA processing protein